ncbi:hypothetical protein EDB85DRAFT_1949044 [Lactarius pseudohatsudake]|nr:hypothetical protein EDB85DRAFT_1949044 [Lactarius pseudohatsudake]
MKPMANRSSRSEKVSSCLSLHPRSPSPRSSTARLMHFNTLPRQSIICLPVYNAPLDSASTNNELHVLRVSRADVEGVSEMSAFISTSFPKRGSRQGQAIHWQARASPLARPGARPRIAGDTARRAQRNRHSPVRPVHFLLDQLFRSDATLIAQAPLFALLRPFLSGGLDKRAWKQIRAPPGIREVSATHAGHRR